MISARGRDDGIAPPQAILANEIRSDVGVTRVCQVAVRGAANEPTVTRRIEPPCRLAVSDDRRWRDLLLIVPLRSPTTTVPAIAATITVPAAELLVLLAIAAGSILAAVVAMLAILVLTRLPVFPVLPVLPGLPRTVIALAELARWALLFRLARLRGCLI